jgi:hypothetical protein
MNWLEHTYEKIGNQVSLEAIGYKKNKTTAVLFLNVTNHGLSDQIQSDFKIKINNYKFRVINSNEQDYTKMSRSMFTRMKNQLAQATTHLFYNNKSKNYYYLNGLKARSSKIFEIPV